MPDTTPPLSFPPGRPRTGRDSPRAPLAEQVMIGPFLTRTQAARRAGVNTLELTQRPDLLRLRGKWLHETYFAFQFDESGVRPDLGRVVLSLRGRFEDPEIADWLGRPNPLLESLSPLSWLSSGRTPERVSAAARELEGLANRAEAADASGRPQPVPPMAPAKPAGLAHRLSSSELATGSSRVGDLAPGLL